MLRVTVLLILAQLTLGIDWELDEKYKKMPRHEFVEYFNSQNFSWKITDYNRNFHLGVKELSLSDEHFQDCEKVEILKHLPKDFDSRKHWPNCKTIKKINNQGHCGSCWTFGTANTASDRTCIHKHIHVDLSEQDLECSTGSSVCEGGYPSEAFKFWKEKGLVTNKCKPYDIKKLIHHECKHKCEDKTIIYDKDKHFAEKVYKVCNHSIDSIRSEIVKNGPIQASFAVYEDFRSYKHGIYMHSYGKLAGHHSVRVIGYGVEKNVEFWLVANSWGTEWGEKGTFRIKVHQVGFEHAMITGIPKK